MCRCCTASRAGAGADAAVRPWLRRQRARMCKTEMIMRGSTALESANALFRGTAALRPHAQRQEIWAGCSGSRPRSPAPPYARLHVPSLRDPPHPPSLLERPLTWCLELGAKSNLSFAISRAKGFFFRFQGPKAWGWRLPKNCEAPFGLARLAPIYSGDVDTDTA